MPIKFRVFLFTAFLLCPAVFSEDAPVYYSSESSSIEFNTEGKPEKLILQGNVKVFFEDVIILCENAWFNRITGDITAEKPLSLETSQGVFKADYLTYNIYDKKGVLLNVSFAMPPLYGKAEKVEKKEALIILDKGYITTCDLEKKHYRISAERMEYVQDDYIRAEKMRLAFGEKFTVLYLPGFTIDARAKEPPFRIRPGYSTRIGRTIDLIFSHRAGKETDAVVRKRFSLGNEGLGLGLGTSSVERGYSGSGFVYNRWNTERLEIGGLAEFSKSYVSRPGTGRIILDWRWMYDDEFFNDFFYDEFIKKSKTYNYLSFTHNFSAGILNFNFRHSAGEDFLKVEKLPELQFYMPFFQVADLPLFLENDLRLTNFYKEDESHLRLMDVLTVKGRKDAGHWTFTPYLSVGGIGYRSDLYEDKFNLVREAGAKVSATLKKDSGRYTGYFTPAVSLFYRGLDYRQGEIEPFDRIERWNDGKFINLQTDWFFTGDAGYIGRVSLENVYSFDREAFEGSFLKYDVKLTPEIYVEGENEWDVTGRAYKFGVNDLVFQSGRFSYSLGNRYDEESDTSGIISKLGHTVNENWRYVLGVQYDINSGGFTRKSLEVWKKLHCWKLNLKITADDEDFSFFIMAYPILL